MTADGVISSSVAGKRPPRPRSLRELYTVKSIVHLPLYPLAVAARYVNVPTATVRSWVRGREYPTKSHGLKTFAPVIVPADGRGELLSFTNLAEVHVLSGLRQADHLPLPKIRQAVQAMRDTYDDEHPLVNPKMRTDGRSLFLDRVFELVDLNHPGQLALRQVFRDYLRRLVYQHHTVVQLHPIVGYTKGDLPPEVIAIDPRIAFGRPFLVKSGAPTAAVTQAWKSGVTIQQIAEDFDEDAASIEYALRYERAA